MSLDILPDGLAGAFAQKPMVSLEMVTVKGFQTLPISIYENAKKTSVFFAPEFWPQSGLETCKKHDLEGYCSKPYLSGQ